MTGSADLGPAGATAAPAGATAAPDGPAPLTGSSLPPGEPFDPCGPLPAPGVTLLEASAGTGKTFTVAALATRLVAEGVPLSRVLAVTFGRMATAELRDRVRARMVSAETLLGLQVDTSLPVPEDDTVLTAVVAGCDADEVRARRRRLSEALANFDTATITTTHGFCHLVLSGLGVAGRVAAGATLTEDPRGTLDEVVDDLLLRWALRWGDLPFTRSVAREAAWAALRNPTARLEPDRREGAGGLRRRLAETARAEVGLRLLDANLLTYDDLLVRLAETLADGERGEVACERLRDRYSVVLVDEFQDTDPVQWEVVRRAFGTGATTLVLIGDPKQAIYAFRGADVYSYLDAARRADRRFTLAVNWRSDAGLLAAYDALLHPLEVGHPDIVYRPVTASPAHSLPGLHVPPGGGRGPGPSAAPLRIRVLDAGDGLVQLTKRGKTVQKGAAVRWVADDVAADVTRLLGSGVRVAQPAHLSPAHLSEGRPARAEPPGSLRAVSPGDVAVLVRTNHQAATVHASLREAGVPAVVGGVDSVFSTGSARDWLTLFEALEQPASRSRAAAVALGPFGGMTAEGVALADEAAWEDLHARLHRWADVLRRRGVASLAQLVVAGGGVPARLLAEMTGERRLTDIAHVGQLLHAEGSARQLGVSALRAWLAQRIDEASAPEPPDADERSRRLDSDAEAVQVLTVHRSKGLEFPIVYCPYLWDPGGEPRRGPPVVYHDEASSRTLDVGGDGDDPEYDTHFTRCVEEQRGEELRLLYVALTRARHQAVVWWAPGWHSRNSPLGRLLMFRGPGGSVAASGAFDPRGADVEKRLADLSGRVPGHIGVERCSEADHRSVPWGGPGCPAADLQAARFGRRLDLAWGRTSYSGITAASHGDAVGSEPEDPGLTDEPEGATPLPSDRDGAGEADLRAVPAVLAGMPAGTGPGTFVHSVLERADFAAGDLRREVAAVVAGELGRRPLDVGPVDEVVEGLVAALSTPLGPLTGGACLRDVRRDDRLDELGFELPLAGGDTPAGEVLTADIARLFATQGQPGGLLEGYGGRLAGPSLATGLRGYLSGSLDLVIRLRDQAGGHRFFVVDYKTNRLAPPGESLSAWHYRPAALDAEMQQYHYPLQAMLYAVALHRYLRWRLSGYDPAVHLGGVLYLFLRGMVGPDAPAVDGSPCGVFAWRTPPALVTGLSDLLDSGSFDAGRPARSAARR